MFGKKNNEHQFSASDMTVREKAAKRPTKKPIVTTPAPFHLSTLPNSFGSLFDNDELA